ncbi:MAG: NfeD family protein [Burkholderiales bacterium]|nr:NfeD family protein [Burkholderiales bacterium]HET8693432.1 NfeD family protein [Aquabacterium sp.]
MSESALWWIVTGFFVSLEMLSRSAYLFMLALGAAAAAMAASLGAPQATQLIAASIVGGIGVASLHFHLLKRGRLAHTTDFGSELPPVDIGAEVHVDHWESDGTCKVQHKGTVCVGRHFGPHLPSLGKHRIKSVDGPFLVLEQL